jgi:hypothetical protein
MITMRTMALLGLLVVVGLLAGCNKSVELIFVNATDKSMDVQLTTPNEGTESVGMIPPLGGKLNTKVKIPNDDLPANCAWKAGDFNGLFTITKESPDKLWIDIPSGRARDKKTTVHEKHEETHQQQVEQKTIVE